MRGVDVDGRQESSEETRAARGAIVQTLGKRGWTVGGGQRRSTPLPRASVGGTGPYERLASWSRTLDSESIVESKGANWVVGTQAPSTISTFGPEQATWPSQAPSAGHEIENDRPAAMFTAIELGGSNRGRSSSTKVRAHGQRRWDTANENNTQTLVPL